MELSFNGTKIKIGFSFILILSFAAFTGYRDALLVLLFSLLHESGHLASLVLFGVKPYLIEFSFFGLGIKYDNSLSVQKDIIVILCGPAVNLVLYLILKDNINLILFLLNIFPAYPLDGGRLLYLLMPKYAKYISAFLMILMLLVSVYLLIFEKIFSLFLITAYLFAFNLRSV